MSQTVVNDLDQRFAVLVRDCIHGFFEFSGESEFVVDLR